MNPTDSPLPRLARLPPPPIALAGSANFEVIMAKRRKPNLKNPNSRTWRDKADNAWKDAPGPLVCEVCQSLGTINPEHQIHNHHIIGRTNLRYRHNLSNRIRLCANHHNGNYEEISPHGDLTQVDNFKKWLGIFKPSQYNWWFDHKDDKRQRDESYQEACERLKEKS